MGHRRILRPWPRVTGQTLRASWQTCSSASRVLGLNFFEPAAAPPPEAVELYLKYGKIEARGFETPTGFVVRQGSRARKMEVPKAPTHVFSLRSDLREQGVLDEGNEALVFTLDYPFSSPSRGAEVILGRTANGRKEWKASDGRTLKQIQESATGAA